ncbi:MAG TPA: PQQ-binding-like beta-propeller repeat protein [Gemmataceae bacterium]|jgi:outer membrane protein assembly factor BamB|nr:PQQ-binding-like beta-propeller repeat protein [Gemmataceae bacterium]
MISRISFACSLFLISALNAGEWPQFRGPNGDGVSDEVGVPTAFGPDENVRWKAELPGRSVASPVVYGKKVFISAASGPRMDRLHALCLDADTGKILWHRQMTATGNTACHPKSSMAAPTPCVNADGVYFLFATADLAAFDLDGNLRWYRSLVGDYPDVSNQVGMASSPILWKDFLIVPMDTVGDSFLAAIDTKYGKNVWKIERPKDTNWITPTLRTVGDKAEIVFSAMKDTHAYDAATGKKTWTLAVKSAQVPMAVTSGDRLLLPFDGGLMCLKPDGDKMVEVWKAPKMATGYTSPLVYKDHVYGIGRAGTLICTDLKTGRDVWSERIGKGKGQYWASPIVADGFIYTFDDSGTGAVVQAGGEKAKVVSTIDLKAEIMGTPAIANKALYIPTSNGLYCIGGKKS